MRTAAHVVVGFVLITLTGALWRVTPFEVAMPDIGVAIALYLGLTAARARLTHAVAGAVALGLLGDIVAGAPRGLGALVLGVTCLACRLVTSRLLLRGAGLIAGFGFLGALFAQLVTLGLRGYLGAGGRPSLIMLTSAALTGAAAPLVFRVCRAVDARFARTQREREALREGYLT